MLLRDFIRQKPYERVQRSVRQNLTTFLPYCAMFYLLLLLPIIIRALSLAAYPDLEAQPFLAILAVLGTSVYLLLISLFFYSFFVNYYLNELVITNDRLIRVTQINLFSRTVTELDLYQIQDATSSVHGFWQSLFNYGDVTIETAGEGSRVIAHKVSHPNEIRQLILELAENDKHYHKK